MRFLVKNYPYDMFGRYIRYKTVTAVTSVTSVTKFESVTKVESDVTYGEVGKTNS